LNIRESFPEDSGIFTCRVTNPGGMAECSAELFVEEAKLEQPPEFIKALSPDKQVIEGETAILEAQVDAYPPPRFTWMLNGMDIVPNDKFEIQVSGSQTFLIIQRVTSTDSGEYVLKAENELGETTCRTTLIVAPSQKLVELPPPHEVTSTTVTEHIKVVERDIKHVNIHEFFIQPLQPE
ncbi:unnamed protein product, partial [Owenia fusiformis]